MGLYASLHAPLTCPRCHQGVLDHAQFHLGDVHDLPTYELGQRIRYDAQRSLGPKVMSGVAVGYAEPCTRCGKDALVSIVIEQGTLQSIHFRSSFSWERDTVLIGPERVGDDGVLRHGAWFVVAPTSSSQAHPEANSRPEETLLQEPLLAHLMIAWAEGSVTLRATRDAHGRCVTEWSRTSEEATSLPQALAQRLDAAPLSSTHLGEERAAFRLDLPDASSALATLHQSHPKLAPTLVHSIALGILAPTDWRL